MNTRAEFVEQDCTIEHAGRKFTSGGAWRGESRALVYVSADEREVTTWHGERVGSCERGGSRRNPFSSGPGHRLYAYRVTMTDGTQWHGLGSGAGMSLKLRRRRVRGRFL